MSYGSQTYFIMMGKLVAFLAVMVFMSAVVECRDLRNDMLKRIKRGYNNGYGREGGYGQDNEQNASVSREGLTLCSGEGDSGYSDSRELAYGRDAFSNDKPRRGNRSFSKSTASATASATASNKNHNLAA